jgi:hypothetical protein
MQERSAARNVRARRHSARAMAARQRPEAPWWLWAALAAGLLAAMPAWAQSTAVPERQAPTIPPGAGGDRGLSTPRSETPSAPLDGARPIPDRGVVAPPSTGSTPVIRPPAAGTMPVIPPPGSAGGDKSVIPK